MKSKYARWGFSHLLAIVMIVSAGSAFAAGESLMHNSNNLGTKYGTWGVAGGTYGEFTCTTCHSTATNNVKRIVESIPDTIGPNVNKAVVFNNMTAFGDDSVAHATSYKICEVCHTQTKYHQYNTANAPQSGDLTHPNGDCRDCHSHADAFKAAGCNTCHGHNAAGSNPIATGQHSAHMNNATLLGANYSCADCHAPTVSSDTTFSNVANHNQNKSTSALPGDPNVNYGGTLAGTYSAGTCTAYCHTNGKGGAAATAVNWISGPALDCKGCHGGAGSVAGEPAYVSGGGGTPTSNSHDNHVAAAADCVNCHVDTTATGTSIIGSHTNQVIDVRNGNGKTFTYTNDSNKTCSNISCHSGNGIISPAPAQWGATLDCTGCHATTALSTGKHNKHLNATNATSFNCGNCHADTAVNNTTLAAATTTHMNAAKNVKFDANNGSGAFDGSSCTNLYCHSYGTTTVGPFKVKTVASWSGSAVTCISCHGGDSTTGLLNNMSTGRHKKHMVGQYSYGCAVCHAATVSSNNTISDPAKHVNVQIDVAFSGTAVTGGAGATYTNSGHAPGQPGAVTDSCQNIYCHSNAQVQPGHANPQFRNLTGNKRFSLSTAAGLGCSGCHGSSTTTGQWALSGKHLAHTAAPVSFNCNQCHLNGGTNNNRANHANGMANYSSQWTGQVTLSSGQCNNVYCHSNGKGTFVNMTAANWFSARTLDCKGCHGGASSNAGEPSYVNGGINNAMANNHPQHVGTTGADATCQNCHRRTVTGTFLNGSTHNVTLGTSSRAIPYHADQSMSDASAGVYAGNGKTFTYVAASKTCSNISCHSGNGLVAGVADAQWGDSLGCEGCHGGSGTNKIVTGKHGQHTNNAAVLGVNFGCVECHAQTVTNDTTLKVGNTTHMNALANFSGAKAGKNSASCATSYCHSNGKGDAGTAVSWSAAQTLDCKGCHGGASSQAGEPFYTSTLPGTLKTNSHPKHVGTTSADATCQNCHGSTMNGTVLSATGNHLNGSITVLQGNSKTFTYSNDSSKTCSNISCHSGGGMFTAADAQWGATMPADCTGCHGNEVNAATKLSGAHNAHVNSAAAGGSFKCKDCHAPTITNADNRTIANANIHGNTIVNYSGAKAGKNKTCSNIYCHSNGKGVFAAIPAWVGGSADCQSCHASAALSGTYAHTTHLNKSATCAQCHSATTTASNTITGATHIDGSVNLQQFGTFGVSNKTVEFAYAGAGTCNNISCHSPASAGPYSNTATWGVKANCATCHPNLSGAHQVHMGALTLTDSSIYYNMTANRTPAVNDTNRKHGFGCAECHPMNDVNHLNGAIDVDLNRVNVPGVGSLRFLNASSASYDMANTKKCSNIYCHSNASRVEAESNVKANTSLAWTDTFAAHPTMDRCAACHGNQPTTGAHVAHAISNHADNIYNGTNGKVGFSGTGNSAHGNPNTTTTITCYICHTDTVSATAHGNDKNTRCIGCHDGSVAPPKGEARINNLANHVNGSREIKFAPIKVRSKAQVRPSSFKFYSGVWKRTYYKNMTSLAFDEAKYPLDTATMWHPSTPSESKCSNLACHNGYEAKWNMANWNDPNKCMDCHFKL